MTDHETTGGSDFPIDETAPVLYDYAPHDIPELFHVSRLRPDPEAKVDLTAWARLYYQMCYVDPSGETPAIAATPEATMAINFPIPGLYKDNQLVTWISMDIGGDLKNEHDGTDGRLVTSVSFDLTRPGVVTVKDVLVVVADAMPTVTRFTPASDPVEKSGLYMAKDGSRIAFKEACYELDTQGVEEIITLLRQASAANEEVLVQRLGDSLEAMNEGPREACYRYFALGKSLIRQPEELLIDVWQWGSVPRRLPDDMRPALHGWSHDAYMIYAPPGVQSSDSEVVANFLECSDESQTAWTKTTWSREALPDDFLPMFEDPTAIEALTLEEVLEEIPEAQKVHLAEHHLSNLQRLAWYMSPRPDDDEWKAEYPERWEDLRRQYAREAAEYLRYFPDYATEHPVPVIL